ncbi:MAG TPA: MBL fold metallo-hydrolase [Longimicrobiaceae bacterium]|nr:MBL fold metallo-hydrolase [Longimicrobiaceae bacterium]
MAVLHLLGTGAAYSDATRTTTMLAFESAGSTIVVDCGGDAVQRLLASQVDPATIDALIVTHEHPDHVAGFPLFVERLWVGGRERPIDVYGIDEAVAQARRAWEAFDTSSWDVPELRWHRVERAQRAAVLETEHWRVTAAPGIHPVPVVGVRVEDARGGGAVAYSCDTERAEAITGLAANADILVHEATGRFRGHTGNEDAARVARDAGVRRLVLVHLPPDPKEEELAEARSIFPQVEYGHDGGRYEF